MNRLTRLFSAGLLAIFLSGMSIAAETPPITAPQKDSATTTPTKKKTTKTKKPKVQKFVGNISAVDTKSGAVSVKGTTDEKNFITQDAAKDALERLAVGDRVRVQYTDKDGKLMTSSVRRVKLPQSKPAEDPSKSKFPKVPEPQKQTKEAVK